ncbi:hypothetical protein HNQ07_004714 [Deinococcus metalli]|uniref:Uncharacterized protein n=1 Tax=Deinococcus metalli TaxID=1141878 RepID=A0A7W8KM86_9DEIO|nr:hypothetical protein [Deinococcus metalli]MBB5379199.1 hypothetical protein [Deinococcus metalli]GHF65167.1 hypothetical protein GCM10017781_46130 [Deinococcus metalli]
MTDLLQPCDVCEKLPGMIDRHGLPLCPRCGREQLLADGMAEHLRLVLQHHVRPHLQATVKTWAEYWVATGLLEEEDAVSTAEWGLSLYFKDPYLMARELLTAPLEEKRLT